MAEYVYSKWSGEELDREIYETHGDHGDFANGLIEVKGSTWCGNLDITLKFTKKDGDWDKAKENKSCAYVLVRIKDGFCYDLNYCHLEIIGWINSERFNFSKKVNNRVGHEAWEVGPECLVREMPENQERLIELALKDNQRLVGVPQESLMAATV